MERDELWERYKLAYAEYRAEVALGWDRQKLFLTLSPALTAGIGAFAKNALAARLSLAGAALIALLGALVVYRSHGRYRAARASVMALEDALGVSDLQTTGGQRAERGLMRLESFRIVDLVVAVFVLLAALDVALAMLWH